MSAPHKIACYPVGNGDTTQIILSNGRRILLDYCHRKKGEETESPEIDLKERLKQELKNAERDYFDIVAFTHADLDHIQSSTEFFDLQHAEKYQGEGRIRIRCLWVPAAMLLEEVERDEQSEEFCILRQEARHRLLEGKDILVFSKPDALKDWLEPKLKERGEAANARDHLFIDAGTIVPGLSQASDGIEFFCHSPFIKHCDGTDIVRNTASLVFNVRFLIGGENYDYFHVGDTEWTDIEDIVKTTLYHKNDDRLAWDLYNIPHHCSYLALSDEKGDTETNPKPLIKHLLLQGKNGAYMVSSSKPIPDIEESYKETQPPHIQARKAYKRHLEEVDGRKLLVTMEEPNANKPEPLVFEIAEGGITWRRAASLGAAAILTSRPPRAGS